MKTLKNSNLTSGTSEKLFRNTLGLVLLLCLAVITMVSSSSVDTVYATTVRHIERPCTVICPEGYTATEDCECVAIEEQVYPEPIDCLLACPDGFSLTDTCSCKPDGKISPLKPDICMKDCAPGYHLTDDCECEEDFLMDF
jgi:hypothetical protein